MPHSATEHCLKPLGSKSRLLDAGYWSVFTIHTAFCFYRNTTKATFNTLYHHFSASGYQLVYLQTALCQNVWFWNSCLSYRCISWKLLREFCFRIRVKFPTTLEIALDILLTFCLKWHYQRWQQLNQNVSKLERHWRCYISCSINTAKV